MAEEISRKTVLVLVLVAVIVSLFSTTLVMKTVYRNTVAQEQAPPSTGKVSLTVPPPEGKVQLTVIDENGQVT